ncbi:hypothetical protein HYV82_05440 [Candidatus Woesearchaeota archaeon]|nr:hypothetical protein [Candidatus Woesearchaeota archaeon]
MAKKTVASGLAFIAIAAILIAFAQSQPAFAAVNDFSAYASPNINACGCGTAEGSITIRNTGDFENLFVISASGGAAEFVTIFPQSFTLKPGEQETVHEFVSSPCGAEKEKAYDLAVGIRTDTNLQKAMSQKVTVTGCSNIGLALSYQNNTGCRCNKLTYVFTLNNTGSYAETYKFAADGLARNTAITPRETTLGPGNYETIRLQLSPECGQQSEYFSFTASAGKSGFTANIPLRMLINDSCYGVANYTSAPGKILIPEKYSVLLLYLPLAILFILTAMFAAMTLSRKPKPAPAGESIEKIKAKPGHYPWEQRFTAKTQKLAARRMERAERKKLFTINAALAVLVIAFAAVIAALVFSQIISVEKASISNLTNATPSNATNMSNATAATGAAANITPETTANVTAQPNASLKANFTFPPIKMPNITGFVSSLFRSQPNATRRSTSLSPQLPAINMTERESQRNATAGLRINFTGIKDSVSSFGSSIGSMIKGLVQRNETENKTTQPANESATLKSFAAAYYGYIIAGFAVLALIIIVLRMAESRQK